MSVKRRCFDDAAIKGLKETFDSRVKDGMTEDQIRDIGTQVIVEYFNKLDAENTKFRNGLGNKTVKANPVTYEVAPVEEQATPETKTEEKAQEQKKPGNKEIKEKKVNLLKHRQGYLDTVSGNLVEKRGRYWVILQETTGKLYTDREFKTLNDAKEHLEQDYDILRWGKTEPETKPEKKTKSGITSDPIARELASIQAEIESYEMEIEDFEDQIRIEKGNLKEDTQKIREKIAEVRKEKMDREEKADRIDELKGEIEDLKDDHDGLVEQYKEDIKAAKSEIKKLNRKLDKLKAEKAKPNKDEIFENQIQELGAMFKGRYSLPGTNQDLQVDFFTSDEITRARADEKYLDSVVSALGRNFPGININVSAVATAETVINKMGMSPFAASMVRGVYDNATGTVYLNPNMANKDTPVHEFGHVWTRMAKLERPDLWMKGMQLIKDSTIMKELWDSVARNPQVAIAYPEHKLLDEALAIAIGRRGAKLFEDAQKQAKWQQWLSQLYDYLKQRFRIDPKKAIEDLTLKEFVDLAATEILTGERIAPLEEGVSDIADGPGVFLQANFSDWMTGLTFLFDKNESKFEELERDGFITRDKLLSDFNGKKVVLHQPDRAFSGLVLYKGNILIEGKGGVFYPIKFHKDGYFWASTRSAAEAMAKLLNDSIDPVDGKIRMALTTAPLDKTLSSTLGANGVMEMFTSPVFQNEFGLSKSVLARILSEAAISSTVERKIDENGKVTIKEVGLRVKVPKNNLTQAKDIIREKLGADNSIFADRKHFATEMLRGVADYLNKTDKATSKKMGEFFKGHYPSMISRGGKVSMTNLTKAVSYMMSEPMLRNETESGLVYAVIEAPGKVEPYETKKDESHHPSYPFAVRLTDKNAGVTIHILKQRELWSDRFAHPETGAPMTKEEQTKIYPPSAGVSVAPLQVINSPAQRAENQLSLQMYDVNKDQIFDDIQAAKKAGYEQSVVIEFFRRSLPTVEVSELEAMWEGVEPVSITPTKKPTRSQAKSYGLAEASRGHNDAYRSSVPLKKMSSEGMNAIVDWVTKTADENADVTELQADADKVLKDHFVAEIEGQKYVVMPEVDGWVAPSQFSATRPMNWAFRALFPEVSAKEIKVGDMFFGNLLQGVVYQVAEKNSRTGYVTKVRKVYQNGQMLSSVPKSLPVEEFKPGMYPADASVGYYHSFKEDMEFKPMVMLNQVEQQQKGNTRANGWIPLSSLKFGKKKRDVSLSDTGPVDYQKTDRLSRVMRWAKKHGLSRKGFSSDAGLPREVANVIRSLEYSINQITDQTATEVNMLRKVIKDSIKKVPERTALARTRAIKAYMTGEDVNLSWLDADQLEVIDFLRSRVDDISGQLLSKMDEMFDVLVVQMENSKNKIERDRIKGELERMGELMETIEDRMGTYMKRSYQAFHDKQYIDVMMSPKKNAEAKRRVDNAVKFVAEDLDVTYEKAEEYVYEYLDSLKGHDFYLSAQMSGTIKAPFLKKRKDIPAPIRELLGESSDPLLDYTNTIFGVSKYLATLEYQDRLYRSLSDFGMLQYEGGEGMTKLTNDRKAWPLLRDAYVPIDVLESIELMAPLEPLNSWAMRQIVGMSAFAKVGKTVRYPTVVFRNILSGLLLSIQAGFNPFSKNLMLAVKQSLKKGKIDEALRKELLEEGVLGEGAASREMLETVNDFSREIDRITSDKFIHRVSTWTQKIYALGDDAYRVIGYLHYKSAYLKNGFSEKDARTKAAQRIIDTFPTYSKLPRIIREVRRWPFNGSFVSFPWEVVRTNINALKYINEDALAGRKNMALSQAAGVAVAHGVGYAIAYATMSWFGIDDDDNDRIRDLLPEYQQNSLLAYMGDRPGIGPRFMDLSWAIPNEVFHKSIRALLTDREGWDNTDKVTEAAWNMLEPYLGWDINTKVIGQIAFNQDQYGREIYDNNWKLNFFDNVLKIGKHYFKGSGPGVFNNINEFMRAFEVNPETFGEKVTSYGREYTPWTSVAAFFGFRITEFDYARGIESLGYRVKEDLDGSRSKVLRGARSSTALSEDKVRDIVDLYEAVNNDTHAQIQRAIETGRKAGLSDDRIYDALESASISKQDSWDYIDGYKPYLKYVEDSSVEKKIKDLELKVSNEEARQKMIDNVYNNVDLFNKIIDEKNDETTTPQEPTEGS